MGRILLPFLLMFFFCPEPAQPAPDDYLPSATARLGNIKTARSISPVKAARSDSFKFALAIGCVPFTAVFHRLFVVVYPSQSSLYRYFIGHRFVRAPPRWPL